MFADEVHDMADFIEQRPALLGPKVVILAREPTIDNARPDFLAWDTAEGVLLIVELKNQPATPSVLLQTLKYADGLCRRPDIARHYLAQSAQTRHAQFNPEQQTICIVAPHIVPELSTLCRYIAPFQFRFIELRTVHDMGGRSLLTAHSSSPPIAPPLAAVTHARTCQETLDYQTLGIRPAIFSLLQQWLAVLQSFAEQVGLQQRGNQKIRRFQDAAGHTAFTLSIRKTQAPVLALHLGKLSTLESVPLTLRHHLRHQRTQPGVWQLTLDRSPRQLILPPALLAATIESGITHHQCREWA